MGKMVTKVGFYDGKFRKPGQFHSGAMSDDIPAPAVDLDSMTKDELLAEAERRSVEVKSGSTKAEILSAISAT